LPYEEKAVHRAKIRQLRSHFQRFNIDVAELCQWWMSIRKRFGNSQKPESFGTLGDFLLEPSIHGVDAGEKVKDRWRLAVFDAVAGFTSEVQLQNAALPSELRQSISEAAQATQNTATKKLFLRLGQLEKPHRLVLLKSAAEWIIARYQRGTANWVNQTKIWAEEKSEWELQHPELTPEIRERYNAIYRQLKLSDSKPRRVNPRICPLTRIREGQGNCIYAEEKGHGPRCWKYSSFTKLRKKENPKFNNDHFESNAVQYLRALNRGKTPEEALGAIHTKARHWFPVAYRKYLDVLGLKEAKLLRHSELPHCLKIDGVYEKSKCEHNPHTELCKQYAELAKSLSPSDLSLEDKYLEWRKRFFKGPSKPVFRYPSSDELPMPKVFGDGFHEIDLDRSVLRLRLDGMLEGEWMEFGLIPWPNDYSPSRKQVVITSVHINFIGTRARAGLRFDVQHLPSRFGCKQEQIDILRSRVYPRRSNDEAFLDAAKKLLLDSFQGQEDLRVMSVDLGSTGCGASFYHGRHHRLDVHLPIIKVHQLFTAPPALDDIPQFTEAVSPDPRQKRPDVDALGLSHKHILWHLDSLSKATEELAKRRSQPDLPAGPQNHDLRGDTRHVRWMIRDWVRLNARQIIDAAEKHGCDLIVFESMRGLRLPGYNEAMGHENKKRREGLLAFGRVRRKVTEKAVERGMRTITVPYGRSSQVCSSCGRWQCDTASDKKRWKKDKDKKRFICKYSSCPLHLKLPKEGKKKIEVLKQALDSDINAARVLARVFWGEITLPTLDDVKAAEAAEAVSKPKRP
jgi:hypothetical protein